MKWLTVHEAALWLATTHGNVRVIANRDQWRRRWQPTPDTPMGKVIAYALDDVADSLEQRAEPAPRPRLPIRRRTQA